jgi:hypothetical protein
VIPEFRRRFNADFHESKYRRLLELVEGQCGPVPFRISETPCFLPYAVLDKLAAGGVQLIEQLTSNAEYRRISEATIPDKYRVPNEPDHPMFVQVDFGLVRNEQGEIEPKLVEIQGFPSLYAFQPVLGQAYLDGYELDPALRYLPSRLSTESYRTLLGDALLGGHDPENVVLLEIDPEHQKTVCDFRLTEKWFGVKAVCITKVRKVGNKLFHGDTPIHRIYNRAIVDELERRNVQLAFDFRDDLDVEWAGHPNFYFRISKFSIPYLNHPSIPKTRFLDQVDEVPADLENYVLKPLYSFAGLGVVVGPTREEIDAIPADKRHEYILQERCDFAPLFETPHGPTKAEIRMMYLWDKKLMPVSTIIRMGRGKMMGVDQNKGQEWVGASAGLWL